jgi:hypothetical protein
MESMSFAYQTKVPSSLFPPNPTPPPNNTSFGGIPGAGFSKLQLRSLLYTVALKIVEMNFLWVIFSNTCKGSDFSST